MSYGNQYINPDYCSGDKIHCPPTVEDNLIHQRNVRRLDRWDREAGMKSDFIITINRACRDYTEQ